MKIVYLNGNQQSDYPNGCVQIKADGANDAFKLGMIAEELRQREQQFTCADSTDIYIRIPATPEFVG